MSATLQQSCSVPAEVRNVALPTGLMELKVDAGAFRLDDLIGFAARANAKRGFLFLSLIHI